MWLGRLHAQPASDDARIGPKHPTPLSRYSRLNCQFLEKHSTAMTLPEFGIEVMGKGSLLQSRNNFERN
jgi:hypothetical protein